MKRVLVIKTSVDIIFEDLLDKIPENKKNIVCLIQPSKIVEYQKKYSDIQFVDCKNEEINSVPQEVLFEIEKNSYDQIYIPITSSRAYNFGNVMELIRRINYNSIVFYHSDEYCLKIKKKKKLVEWFYKECICFFETLYR